MRGTLVTSGQAYFKLVLKRGDFSKVFDYREVVSSRGNGMKKVMRDIEVCLWNTQ